MIGDTVLTVVEIFHSDPGELMQKVYYHPAWSEYHVYYVHIDTTQGKAVIIYGAK